MKQLGTAFAFGLFIVLFSHLSFASQDPEWAKLTFHRDFIKLEFYWNPNSPPLFDDNTAVEFEVHALPKCFTQPIGGKDNDPSSPPTNLPQPVYKDVWNYWIPSGTELWSGLVDNCEGVQYVDALGATMKKFFGDFAPDADAGFAVGVKNASLLQAGIVYHFVYQTEVPNNCLQDTAYAWVRMQVFPNTCTFWWQKYYAWPLPPSTCPHLIGFTGANGCTENDPVWHIWKVGICAPTDDFLMCLPVPPVEYTNPPFPDQNNLQCTNVQPSSCYPCSLVETCDNGVDDDCNGQIDCADWKCATESPCCGIEGASCCSVGTKCTVAGLTCDATNHCALPQDPCFNVQCPDDGNACDGPEKCVNGQCKSGPTLVGSWCAATLPPGAGGPNDLVTCSGGQVNSVVTCPNGCKQNALGTDDECQPYCGNGNCDPNETCAACPTDCGSCPTCSDGVKNQDETGVDCGGSTCPPCASCSDGIQNQGELNVDCGGPSCPACVCVGLGAQSCQNCGTLTRTCNPDGTWSAWGPCAGQNNCPPDQACDGNLNVCVACGDKTQACCAGNLCQSSPGLVCYAGHCASCGGSSQPCCDGTTLGANGTTCTDPLVCTSGFCQPTGNTPSVVFFEDFENIVWDHIGQGDLPDGISIWDTNSVLHTSLGAGAPPSLEGFVWHGGGIPGNPPAAAATMSLPAGGLQGAVDVRLSFDATTSAQSALDIVVGRLGCPTQTVSISSQVWTHHSLALSACGVTSAIVFQVGAVQAIPANAAALTLDNLKIEYIYPEVCDGLDNNGDGQVDEGVVCQSCQGQCALGDFGCQGAFAETDCIAPSASVPCNHYSDPYPCASGSGCFPGLGCQICGGIHEQCCPGGTCNPGKSCWQGSSCELVINGCIDRDEDGYADAACGGSDCNDSNALVKPGMAESCNGIDDNCNGQVDEGDPGGGGACTTGVAGACAAGTLACQGGALNCIQNIQASLETCDGIDNNCDGSIDENCCFGSVASGQFAACIDPSGTLYVRIQGLLKPPLWNQIPDAEIAAGEWTVPLWFTTSPPGYPPNTWFLSPVLTWLQPNVAFVDLGALSPSLPADLCPYVASPHAHTLRLGSVHLGAYQEPGDNGIWAGMSQNKSDYQPGLIDLLPNDQGILPNPPYYTMAVAKFPDPMKWGPSATLAHDDMYGPQVHCSP